MTDTNKSIKTEPQAPNYAAQNDEHISPVVYFELDAETRAERRSSTDGLVFPNYEQFLASGVNAQAFVVAGREVHAAEQLVTRLRSDHHHYLKPIYVLDKFGPLVDALSDGPAPAHKDMDQRIDLINDLAATLPELHGAQDKEDRLLRFLYVRPEFLLKPVKDWRKPKVYYYPLLEAVSNDGTDTSTWLNSLHRRNLLEADSLIDRLRDCPKCGYSHLSFVDACPSCKSIDIDEKPFLHCHSCGNVAPQESFLGADGLVCARCNTRLRHIGVDYDHSLENFSCNHCNHTFIDPLIEAHCMHCDATPAMDELVVRNVEDMRLSEVGRLAVRSGNLGDIYSVLDDLNYASPSYFRHMLNWQTQLVNRHADVRFSLLCIKLENVLELVDKVGRNRVMLMLDGLAVRLRNLIRTSDIATRTSEQHYWLLLPQTPGDGCQVLLDRIKDIQQFTRQDDGTELELSGAFVSAPEQLKKGETAELLMAQVQGKLD